MMASLVHVLSVNETKLSTQQLRDHGTRESEREKEEKERGAWDSEKNF